jgi:ferritin-like metal-binding protein YciE
VGTARTISSACGTAEKCAPLPTLRFWVILSRLGLAWLGLALPTLNGTLGTRAGNPPNRLRVGIHLTTAPNNEEARMMKSMEDLFYNLLQDVYYAEKQLVKTLPKLAKKSTSPELEKAFMDHRAETERHVERLERVFEMIGKKARARKCDAILGIIKEGEEVMKQAGEDGICDAGLLAAAQAAEHYEIARYGTLCAWAKTLGHDDAVGPLQETLQEEKKADALLTSIAESGVNEAAMKEAA